MEQKFREPVNGFTHMIGAIISLIGLIAMIEKVIHTEDLGRLALGAVIAFGVSLICLYTTSCVYHLSNKSPNVIAFLRKLDHSMIFVLIAGTYTPICLIALTGKWRWTIFITIWTLAIAGILFKMLWFNAPRWISTLTYIIMGWLVIIAFAPLKTTMATAGLVWMVIGGVLYTVGGIMYALKAPNINAKWGFHEIFHIFILLGSLSHFVVIFKYIL